MIEALAHRYGCDPWEVLTWDAARLGFNRMCYRHAADNAATLQERIAQKKDWVFPVVVLWEGVGGF